MTAKTGHPVLAVIGYSAIPGTVLRPLADPVPLSPVSLVWRRGLRHPGVDALRTAAAELAAAGNWLVRRDADWVPREDAEVLGAPPGPGLTDASSAG